MCLDKVYNNYDNLSKKVTYVWKVFRKKYDFGLGEEKGLFFQHKSLSGDKRVRMGKWLMADHKEMLYDNLNLPYEAGFHCYKKRSAARNGTFSTAHTVVKVKISEITSDGIQHGEEVVVARKMLVPVVRK
jgi:hypothetical protein